VDHGSDIHIRKEQDKFSNRDEGSCQLPHIYHYFLPAAATPGGQSFRRRQQRLHISATSWNLTVKNLDAVSSVFLQLSQLLF